MLRGMLMRVADIPGSKPNRNKTVEASRRANTEVVAIAQQDSPLKTWRHRPLEYQHSV